DEGPDEPVAAPAPMSREPRRRPGGDATVFASRAAVPTPKPAPVQPRVITPSPAIAAAVRSGAATPGFIQPFGPRDGPVTMGPPAPVPTSAEANRAALARPSAPLPENKTAPI